VAKPKFALDGFCPVSLVEERRWAKGDPRWGVVHRGQTYVFASEANAKKFWTDPDAFSPMLSGFDPVKFAEQRQWFVGKRQFGVFYKDENSGKTSIVLFADEGALQRFWTDPKRYSGQVQQALQLNGQSHLR
jgi:protein disulfide-isomerase